MDNLLIKLKEYGADIDGAMGRFLNDIDLYKSCFESVLKDENFHKLGEYINESDYILAFESAHTLKGITGNMGLIPIYNIVCKIVTDLRKSDYLDLQNDYKAVAEQLSILKSFF